MPEPTTEDRSPIEETIQLPPTVRVNPVAAPVGAHAANADRPRPAVAMVDRTVASLGAETEALLRRRLFAAALALSAIFGLLLIWVFASDNPATLTVEGSRFSPRVGLLGVRCLLAAAIAGILGSAIPLSRKQLRTIESILFLGLAFFIVTSQYLVNLDLMHRGLEYAPMILAFIKDGVIQMFTLIIIYGTLIPNKPSVAARTILIMFASYFLVAMILAFHPDLAPIVKLLNAAEERGSNLLFLAISTTLAIYCAYLINGLRTELHEARKFGQYRLVKKLGEGGMGEVHLAEHALLKRPCALKLIKAEAGANPVALARFELEVQSAARLAHPNTIEIYDYGHTSDGTFYYVMEFLKGLSLADLVEAHGPLPPGRVIFIFRQVCAGLTEAHELGLVHRDMKPANVFIAVRGGESDVAKVLDFGLVKITRDPGAPGVTGEATVSGTPLYMAPEQAMADRALDARADVYALGCMMYFALTGQPPFTGEGAFAVMMAHARDPVTPPSQVRPGVPADLEAVVLRCLAKKPADRFGDVKSLGKALAACASASEWSAEQADRWWAAAPPRDPSAPPPQPIDQPPQPAGVHS
jgi:serine/threonine-protein kinase